MHFGFPPLSNLARRRLGNGVRSSSGSGASEMAMQKNGWFTRLWFVCAGGCFEVAHFVVGAFLGGTATCVRGPADYLLGTLICGY